MSAKRSALAGAAISVLMLGGCGIMPASGPTISELEDRAEKNPLNFKMVEVTPAIVAAVGEEGAPKVEPVTLTAPTPTDQIGIGDVLQISIFETGTGLFAHGDSGATATALPPLSVGRDGTITVPYVGRIRAAGQSPADLQARIETALSQKASQPQVVVAVAANINNTIVVSGDVRSPGRFPLTAASERLIDAVAVAGGPANPPLDTIAEVTRGQERIRGVLGMIDVLSPSNVVVAPGDEIRLVYQPRTITVMGASGKVGVLPLDTAHVTLAQAIAKAAGPSDEQADPTGVYLFRFEPAESARKLGFETAGDAVPVIYHLDLLDPTTYFLVQKYAVQDKDVIYVANSEGERIKKFLTLLQSLFSPVTVAAPAHNLSN
jgi:polysaccharide export outer membrane protein